MAENALTTFGSTVPAHIAAARALLGSNLPERTNVPSLGYEGKIWSITLDGNKTKLMTRNEDGDEIPVGVFRGVILDCAQRRGRAYYEGSYDPNKVSAPKCWSPDGVTPHKSVSEPCAKTCELCRNAVKGSKINDSGVATTACSQHRMLAVIPSTKLDFKPLRLKIAITSDFDGQSPDMEAQGWFSFSKYRDYLKSRGVAHTAEVVTKMRFDPGVAYPKLFFAAERWLTGEELAQVSDKAASDEVKQLIDGSWSPDGANGVQTAKQAEDVKSVETPAREPEPEPEPEPIASETIVMDMGDDMPSAKPAKTAKKVTEKVSAETAPQASTDVPDEVAALLSAWGNN